MPEIDVSLSNPAAPHHLPAYIPGPDGSDPLFTAVVRFDMAVSDEGATAWVMLGHPF